MQPKSPPSHGNHVGEGSTCINRIFCLNVIELYREKGKEEGYRPDLRYRSLTLIYRPGLLHFDLSLVFCPSSKEFTMIFMGGGLTHSYPHNNLSGKVKQKVSSWFKGHLVGGWREKEEAKSLIFVTVPF